MKAGFGMVSVVQYRITPPSNTLTPTVPKTEQRRGKKGEKRKKIIIIIKQINK